MMRSTFCSWRASLLLSAALAMCACSGGKRDDTAGSARKSPVVSGWAGVVFGIDDEYISRNRGLMYETYDEFVGGLFDEGLRLSDTGWLKPTYGNENLLWTLDPDIGKCRQDALAESKAEFPEETYEFSSGSIDIRNSTWKYAGYADRAAGDGPLAFRTAVFVCEGSSSGVSVFYWGEGTSVPPEENQSVKDLLLELSSYCR